MIGYFCMHRTRKQSHFYLIPFREFIPGGWGWREVLSYITYRECAAPWSMPFKQVSYEILFGMDFAYRFKYKKICLAACPK